MSKSAYLKRIPNIKFTDTDNNEYYIHDLLKDKVICINLFYANCIKKCIPIGKNLCKVNRIIGKEKLDEYNIQMISITFDPINDTIEDVNNYRKCTGADQCHNWLFLRGDPDETDIFRRRIGMYDEDSLIDCFKQNHSGNVLLMNEKINRKKMCGGFENCLNIVSKCYSLVLPYAYRYTSSTIFSTIDYSRFTEEEKISFFNNIITMSPMFAIGHLSEDMMKIFVSQEHIQSKNGHQYSPVFEDSKGNIIKSN